MLADALATRVRASGAAPLVTHYDLDADTRVELSAVTFANWVDKTVNLMDSLGIAEGDRVALPVAAGHPGHWVTLVWVWAAWQLGVTPQAGVAGADLAVVGPGVAAVPGVQTVVACSLHPLGLAMTELPEGAIDYVEVFGQPDAHWANPAPDLAWDSPPVRFDELGEPAAGRVLLPDPADPLVSVRALAAALGGGSLVLVRGGGSADWARIAQAERTELAETTSPQASDG